MADQRGTAMYNKYCGSGGSSSYSAPSSGGYTPQQQMILNGAQQMMPLLQQGVHDLFYGNHQQDAARQAEANRRAQEAAQAAEQQRQLQEQYKAQALQQQERAKQRILGLLKGSEPSPDLALKTGDSDTPLTVTETRSSFGTTVLTPTRIGTPSTVQGLQLKLGDDADASSTQAQQGIDTAGKIMGANLPAPPQTPTSKAPTEKVQILNALIAKLKKNAAEEQLLKDQLGQLQQAPTPDPVAISQIQNKIVTKENEKKKIIVDLTAEDPDPAAGQPSGTPDATSTGATITGASQ